VFGRVTDSDDRPRGAVVTGELASRLFAAILARDSADGVASVLRT
jgi:hypothetical protein